MKNLLSFFKISYFKKSTTNTTFSDFFRNASSSERKKVFEYAGRKANEMQREVFYR